MISNILQSWIINDSGLSDFKAKTKNLQLYRQTFSWINKNFKNTHYIKSSVTSLIESRNVLSLAKVCVDAREFYWQVETLAPEFLGTCEGVVSLNRPPDSVYLTG